MAEFKKIDVSAIDPADFTFRITRAGGDASALASSIHKMGLNHPLILLEKPGMEKKKHPFSMVSGFRRFEAAQSLDHKTLPCQVMPRDQIEKSALLAVAENAFQRELKPGELIRSAALLKKHMLPKAMAEQSMAIFNQNLNKAYIESLIRISELPDPGLLLLDTGQLSIKAAKAACTMKPDDAKSILSLFSKIKVSSGKQMEIITWIREIAAREKISMEELIGSKQIQTLLDTAQNNKDLGVAGNRVRALLHFRRFPELSAAQKKASDQVHSLKLPKGARLTLPENFENMVYSFSIDFTSLGDFSARLKSLSGLQDQTSFKQLLDR